MLGGCGLRNFMKALVLCTGLLLLLGAGSAASYEFGSKVRTGDVDENRLVRPVNLTVFWFETGSVLGRDPTDVAYLHQGWRPAVVWPNDIRLTPFQGYPAGSRVKIGDLDANWGPLFTFPIHAWSYLNLFGTLPVCDIDDPVYYQWALPATPLSVADLRISRYQNLNPGSWVKDNDADFGKGLTSVLNATVWYYDQGGTAFYDDSDPVYLKMNETDFPGHIVPGDLRLTALNGQN